MSRNRSANCHNKYQGDTPKILCVCSAGLLRSPTMAWVLGNAPFSCNTRAAGCVPEYALIPVDEVLIEWADGIVCASEDHRQAVLDIAKKFDMEPPPTVSLDIPDNFGYKDPVLIGMIEVKLKEVGFDPTNMLDRAD